MAIRSATWASLAVALVAMPLLASPAKAWWGPYGWVGRRPVVVVGPPIIAYAPPPVAYAPPPVAYVPPRRPPIWVSPHWYGAAFIPGHWR